MKRPGILPLIICIAALGCTITPKKLNEDFKAALKEDFFFFSGLSLNGIKDGRTARYNRYHQFSNSWYPTGYELKAGRVSSTDALLTFRQTANSAVVYSMMITIKPKDYYAEFTADRTGKISGIALVDPHTFQKEPSTDNGYTSADTADVHGAFPVRIGQKTFECTIRYRIIEHRSRTRYIVTFQSEEAAFGVVRSFELSKEKFDLFKKLPDNDKVSFKPESFYEYSPSADD